MFQLRNWFLRACTTLDAANWYRMAAPYDNAAKEALVALSFNNAHRLAAVAGPNKRPDQTWKDGGSLTEGVPSVDGVMRDGCCVTAIGSEYEPGPFAYF
jgi:hypothetical protein